MENVKKTIAVLAGGFSSEHLISVASGKTALRAFQDAGYATILVILTQEGFFVEDQRVDFESLDINYVFNIIHGAPGEDGHISGFLKVLGIPHSTCDTFQSALTFNKAQCNGLLRGAGFIVPRGQIITEMPKNDEFSDWNFPLFVKPNRSGSSFGVSKVTDMSGFEDAFVAAQNEDYQVLIEEGVQGTEVGCGVFRSRFNLIENKSTNTLETQAIAVTEIVPTEAGFFDYEAKYEGKSEEITPARIADDLTRKVEAISVEVYDFLDLKGIVRIDFIITQENVPVIIEVNSIPGLSPASIIPQQVTYRSCSLSMMLASLAEEAMDSNQ